MLVSALVAIPAWRMFDVVRWWADFLLDRAHYAVMSWERNLIFAVLNLIEAALIAAIWLRATREASSAGTAGYEGFSLVTQMALPPASTVWARIAVVMSEATALVLLVGGVACVISGVQSGLKATGKWHGRPKRRPR